MGRAMLWVGIGGCAVLPPPPTEQVDCDALRSELANEYQAAIDANQACSTTDDCYAPDGACALGFGGCQEAVSTSFTAVEFGGLVSDARKRLEDAGCEASTVLCDCYGGYAAECQDEVCTLEFVGYD